MKSRSRRVQKIILVLNTMDKFALSKYYDGINFEKPILIQGANHGDLVSNITALFCNLTRPSKINVTTLSLNIRPYNKCGCLYNKEFSTLIW